MYRCKLQPQPEQVGFGFQKPFGFRGVVLRSRPGPFLLETPSERVVSWIMRYYTPSPCIQTMLSGSKDDIASVNTRVFGTENWEHGGAYTEDVGS